MSSPEVTADVQEVVVASARTPRRSVWRRVHKHTRRASNFGLRLGLWLLIGFGVVAIARAYFDDEYTLGRFEVPAAVSAAGYSPEVVPRRVYDAMVDMQERSASVRDFRGFSGGRRDGGVDIQVAGFGVSFESVARRLREMTGRTERVFAGEITAEGDSVRLALRQNGQLLARYVEPAPAGVLDRALTRLFERAALRVYRVTEPYLTAVLLDGGTDAERAEALEIIKELITDGETAERPWGLNFLGNRGLERGDTAAADRFFREALAQDPSFRLGYNNLFAVYSASDQTDSLEAIRARAGHHLRGDDQALLWQMDYSLAARDDAAPERLREIETEVLARFTDSEEALSRLHGIFNEHLNNGRVRRANVLAAAALERLPLDEPSLMIHLATSLLLEDWPGAQASLERIGIVGADSSLVDVSRGWLSVGRDSVAEGRRLITRGEERGGLDAYSSKLLPMSQLYLAYSTGDTATQRTIVAALRTEGLEEDFFTDVTWLEGPMRGSTGARTKTSNGDPDRGRDRRCEGAPAA